jgi:CheY-like chemotaxis protein
MEEGKKLHKILLVDDDLISNNLARNLIRKVGIADNVSIVTDGQAALDYIFNPHTTFPELIFLDISMPVMDGFEFLEKFSESASPEWENTRIIILSAFYNEDEVKDVAYYDQVIAYMEKPLDEEKLKKSVEYYFRKTITQG